jgi:integrase/recombinase XerD
VQGSRAAASSTLRPPARPVHNPDGGTDTLLGWYRAGEDVAAKLPLVSTYLDHVDPAATYWYLSAVPELLD